MTISHEQRTEQEGLSDVISELMQLRGHGVFQPYRAPSWAVRGFHPTPLKGEPILLDRQPIAYLPYTLGQGLSQLSTTPII